MLDLFSLSLASFDILASIAGGFLGQGGGAGGVYRALHQLLPLVQPLRAKYHTPDIKSCGTVSDHLANMVESLSVALLVMGLAWMITATRAAKRHKQQIQQAAVEHDNLLQQLSASHKEHTSNVEEVRAAERAELSVQQTNLPYSIFHSSSSCGIEQLLQLAELHSADRPPHCV